jgi:hypothetical protein
MVDVDFGILCDLVKTAPDSLSTAPALLLALFEDTYLTLRIDGIRETACGNTCFTGKIEDQPVSEVIILLSEAGSRIWRMAQLRSFQESPLSSFCLQHTKDPALLFSV